MDLITILHIYYRKLIKDTLKAYFCQSNVCSTLHFDKVILSILNLHLRSFSGCFFSLVKEISKRFLNLTCSKSTIETLEKGVKYVPS